MINKLIEIAFSGIFEFFGVIMLLNIPAYYLCNLLVKMWSRFMRMLMVRKHGWPPSHLDADGDFIKTPVDKKVCSNPVSK